MNTPRRGGEEGVREGEWWVAGGGWVESVIERVVREGGRRQSRAWAGSAAGAGPEGELPAVVAEVAVLSEHIKVLLPYAQTRIRYVNYVDTRNASYCAT